MTTWIQPAVVLLAVTASVAHLGVGMVRFGRGKASGLGGCCGKGCQVTPTASVSAVQYIPASQLGLRAVQARRARAVAAGRDTHHLGSGEV